MSLVGRLKGLVPARTKSRCLYRLSRPEVASFEHLRGRPKVIVALAADYPNLGDIAITHAQTLFLRACLPAHEIVDFPCAATYTQLKALQRVCTPDDLVTIAGGGNMSDLYPSLEDARRFLIERFPRNRVISFPQTMDFSLGPGGYRELARSQRTYAAHHRLRLFAREPISRDLMRRCFPEAAVEMVPDIALSLPVAERGGQRAGVLVCLREDRESTLGPTRRAEVLSRVADAVSGVHVTDTVLSRQGRLSLEERSSELASTLQTFRAAKAVVTDRLHGMILAVVSGTPCVVMPNSNHKILGTFRTWLSSRPDVACVEDASPLSVVAALAHVTKPEALDAPDPCLSATFDPLRRAVLETSA